MINIQNIDSYGIQDPGFELLRQVAQKYCPEELQQVRKEGIPDEALNLSSLTSLLQTFVGTDFIPTSSEDSLSTPLPHREGLGVGLLFLHLVPMLIIVIIAYLYVLKHGDSVVGEGG